MNKTRKIDGVSLSYTDNGSGRPVILMHGWGCSHTTVASIEAAAIAAGCRVINIDFPGFGDSQEPPEPWGVEQYTRQIEQLVSVESIERPTLIGHSFGGRVAILYGSRNDVDKIVLVDAAGVKPRRTFTYYRKVYTFKAMKHLSCLMLGRRRAEALIERRRAAAGSSDYSQASPMMRRILSKVVNEDLRHVMPRIQAPTLLVWGENDTATPLRDARTMERLIPGAALVSFPGCGHYSFLDNPRQFAAVLQSFLRS